MVVRINSLTMDKPIVMNRSTQGHAAGNSRSEPPSAHPKDSALLLLPYWLTTNQSKTSAARSLCHRLALPCRNTIHLCGAQRRSSHCLPVKAESTREVQRFSHPALPVAEPKKKKPVNLSTNPRTITSLQLTQESQEHPSPLTNPYSNSSSKPLSKPSWRTTPAPTPPPPAPARTPSSPSSNPATPTP